MFPNLDDLEVSDMRFVGNGVVQRFRPESSPAFHGCFHLAGRSDAGFIMNISDLPNPIKFREIIWSEMLLEDTEHLGRLASSCASTLEALTIDICDGMYLATRDSPAILNIFGADEDPNEYHPLSLAQNTKLKELTIEMWGICPTDLISHLISTITSPQLSKIWFRLSLIDPDEPSEEKDWRAVDSALVRLCEERAPGLEGRC
jgi:hypothetical protein